MQLRDAAETLGVHYQTVYGWVRQGTLPARKTPRGYEVSEGDVRDLVARRAAGAEPPPEVRVRDWAAQADRLYAALAAGDEARARHDFARLAAGVPLAGLCDQVIAPALRRVGSAWAAGELSIAAEHRATAICERLIAARVHQPQGRPRGIAVDKRAVDLVRVLAMDAVQKVGNGHPGTAMSLAPAAYLLFQRVLRHDPPTRSWPAGTGSCCPAATRQPDPVHPALPVRLRPEPGRPEGAPHLGLDHPRPPRARAHPGVETTTGPLGQGLGNAVGMAMAARRERGLLDPDAAPGESARSTTSSTCFASDGDIEEGITHEASRSPATSSSAT
jgi:excisionase family DNA binding protein